MKELTIPKNFIEETKELCEHNLVLQTSDTPGDLKSKRAAINVNLVTYQSKKKDFLKHITNEGERLWEEKMGYIEVNLKGDLKRADEIRQEKQDLRIAEIKVIIEKELGGRPIEVNPKDYLKYSDNVIASKIIVLADEYDEEQLFIEPEAEIIEEEVSRETIEIKEEVVEEVLYTMILNNLSREESVRLSKEYPGRFTLKK